MIVPKFDEANGTHKANRNRHMRQRAEDEILISADGLRQRQSVDEHKVLQ